MVNTGRPSPACKACRARRLKCDQTKPACIKCIKAKRVCPGYREPFEVNFRDQTQSTIRKHQRSNSNTKSIESDRCSIDERYVSRLAHDGTAVDRQRLTRNCRPGSSSSDESPSTSPNYTPVFEFTPTNTKDFEILRLQPPLELQATCFFATNFIATQSMNLDGGMRFLDPLVHGAQEGSAFHSTFLAASMASLASRPNGGSLVPLARVYYHKALRQVSTVVQDRDKSKEDETLAAIIMLILYEVLMWEDQSQGSLRFHIHGAQAIVKLRGPEQRRSPVGYGMFEFIRAFMVHQYVHSPDYDAGDIKWWASEGSTDEPRHVLQRLNVEATLLRRQLTQFMACEDIDDEGAAREKTPMAYRILRKAKRLDAQLAAWFRGVGDVWQPKIDHVQDEVPENLLHRALAYPGNVYTFNSIWISAKFLNAHTHRLILAEIMAQIVDWLREHQCGSGTYETMNLGMGIDMDREKEEAELIARQQVSEIVAMTPYFCGWPDPASPSPYGGMTCSFQLFVCASSPFISARQKAFMVGRLSHIAQSSGLKLAGKFAEGLVTRLKVVDRDEVARRVL
ncbi:uncharacterized protein BCR38DRAFT_379870 [Pseudomassariella vexata]|uniref:Zn(2)-C6 fungal-type domain-containing protein n=1 Tax=Pseudomassariella vexata TaxID=1141098 RepID=A0A1Y2D9C7_9PEZI|nr:uncharacterized protein BCR38DRAFT_379870 [Pseudomassariella vexata]ORY55863.1 hypothetical protein BCR38DRAFT_379870 [Pseudomassariella vexata]